MCRDKQQWINEVKSVLKGFQTLSLSPPHYSMVVKRRITSSIQFIVLCILRSEGVVHVCFG